MIIWDGRTLWAGNEDNTGIGTGRGHRLGRTGDANDDNSRYECNDNKSGQQRQTAIGILITSGRRHFNEKKRTEMFILFVDYFLPKRFPAISFLACIHDSYLLILFVLSSF